MIEEDYIVKKYCSVVVPSNEKLYLSVLICEDGFVYSISTHDFKNVIELCHIHLKNATLPAFQLKDKISFLVQNYGLNKKKFAKVYISILNQQFILVPSAYAAVEDLKKLLVFSSGQEQIKNISQQHIKNLSFCYTIQSELLHYLETTFSNASIRHNGITNICSLFDNHSLKGSNLFLSVYDSYIELTAKRENDLLFYNVFNYESSEDILYYLLFMMEQFELSPLTVKLAISAQTGISDNLIRDIKKYIKQVNFCVQDSSIKLNGELASLPQHYYFLLLNQHVCEL